MHFLKAFLALAFLYGTFAFAIINGEVVGLRDFPSSSAVLVLQIDDRRQVSYRCSGTLIGETAVLTAGHCVMDDKKNEKISASNLAIYFGSYNGGRWDAKKAMKVADYRLHELYKPSADFGPQHDIALIKLARSSSTQVNYQPAPILKDLDGMPANTEVLIAGFGRMLFFGDPAEPHKFTLRSFKTRIKSPVSSYGGMCKLYSSSELMALFAVTIPETPGHPELSGFGGMAAGDSGGPMYILGGKSHPVAGIASRYGNDNVTPYYENVPSHAVWILSAAKAMNCSVL